jgi:hypothetical protein
MYRVLLSNSASAVTLIYNQDYGAIKQELIKKSANTVVYRVSGTVAGGLNTATFVGDPMTTFGILGTDTVSLVCLATSTTTADVGINRPGNLSYIAPNTTFTSTGANFLAAGACDFGLVISPTVESIVLSDMEYTIADKQALVNVENLTENRVDYISATIADADWHRIEFVRPKKLLDITVGTADLLCTFEDPNATPVPRNSDTSVRPYPALMDPIFQPASTYPKTFTVPSGTSLHVDVQFLDWKTAIKTMWVNGNTAVVSILAY